MRKLLVLALMLAGAAFAREASLYVGTGAETPDIYDGSPGDVYFGDAEFEVDGVTRCDGAVTLGDDPADVITITGSMVLTSPVSFPVGTALLPGIYFTGDPNTGLYWIGADNFGFTAAGGLVGDFDATGLNNCPLGQTTPLAADVTTFTTTGQSDLDPGAVGAPSVVFTGSLTTGLYEVAADSPGMSIAGANVGTWDAAGYQGDLGQTVPGAADVTTLTTTGITDLFAGAVGAPSVTFTGSATTGLYEVAADSPGMSVAGANVGTWDAAGYQGDLGQTVPGAADVTTLTTTGQTDLDPGAVGAPSIAFTGSLTTGFYEVAADSPGVSVAGANIGTWDAAGYQGALGQTVPAAADVTTRTRPGHTDLDPGAVGAPSVAFTGSLTTGLYEVAADSPGISVAGANVGTWDAAGYQGAIGGTTPAAGTFTNVDVDDDFNFGQDPADLVGGYKERGDYITFQDDFTVSVDTEYVLDWDLTTVVGLGTNTVSVRPGWSELVTGGGGGGVDSESTRSWGLSNYRAYAPRIESVVDLTNLVTQRFEWGFWAAANEYVMIVYDVGALGGNWYLQVDDTAGVDSIDSGVAVTVNPTKLEIQVDAAGDVHWAINDVAMTEVGLTNQMTANPHYTWWELTDQAVAAHTVAVDYVIIEQLRQQ